jgi:transcriptional regulator with XRE-family HTH domain
MATTIGAAIARHRLATGLTQEDVAEALDIGPEAVSRLERGVVMPSIPRLVALAEIFKCSLQALVQQASDLPADNASSIAEMLQPLNTRDRQFVISLIQTTCGHFAERT